MGGACLGSPEDSELAAPAASCRSSSATLKNSLDSLTRTELTKKRILKIFSNMWQ